MNRRLFGFLILIISIKSIAFTQYSDLTYTNFNPSNGLSDKEVTCINQDYKGFIWIGTPTGLNRFDGTTFKLYRNTPGEAGTLQDNYIRCILEDSHKRLWICTGKGLHLYDRSRDRFLAYRHVDGDTLTIGNDLVSTIFEDRSGNLWVGHFDGIARLHITETKNSILPGRITFDNHSLCPECPNVLSNWVFSITDDDEGNLWIGTFRYDIVRFSPVSAEFKHYPVEGDSLNLINDSRHWVKKIVRDRNGMIWGLLNNDIGIAYYDKLRDRFDRVMITDEQGSEISGINSLYDVWIDSSNTFFLATGYGLRIVRITQGNGKMRVLYLPDSYDGQSMRSVFFDRHGGLWMGSAGKGIDYADRSQFRFSVIDNIRFPTMSSGNIIYLQSGIDSKLYIELNDKSRYCYSAETGMLTNNENIQGIFANLNRTAEIVRINDKQYFRKKGSGLLQLPDSVTKQNNIKITGDGSLILLGSKGIRTYDPLTGKATVLISEKLLRDSCTYESLFFLDFKDRIWIKSAHKLFRINREKNCFEKHISNLDYSSYTLLSDTSGNLWLTYYNTLYCYEPDNRRLSSYSTGNGLNANNIYSIINDNNNNIWIATNKGLSMFDVVKKYFINYGTGDGLPYMSFFSMVRKDLSGKLYFASLNGVLVFDPSAIITNPDAPDIVITGFRLFNKDVDVRPDSIADNRFYLEQQIGETNEIVLQHDQNVISLEYCALNYTNASKNQYACYLEGLETTWKNMGSKNTVDYSGLQPGTYVFRVKGSNNSGVWNEKGISLKIVILPPFWKTWWFTILLLFMAILIIVIVFRLRMSSIKEQKKILEDQVKERTAEISKQADDLKVLNSTKDKFFSIIAHDLKNPLYSIAGIAELLDIQYPTMDEDSKMKFIKGISISSKNVTSLLENLLQWARTQTSSIASKPENIIVSSVADENISLLHGNAVNKKIVLENKTGPSDVVFADRNMFTTVIRNLVNNAIKFTPDAGIITISSHGKNDAVEIIVADNGVGMSEAIISKLFRIDQHITSQGTAGEAGTGLGLIICKEFIDKNNGSIRVESIPGQGSKFIITLPAGTGASLQSETIASREKYIGLYQVSSVLLPLRKNDSPLILLVEDNDGIKQNLKENIEKYFNYISAANGREGLEKALEEMPDLIISDWMMPEMEGVELCNILKKDERTSHIPVLLLTAKAELRDKLEGLETGADDYLTKPFDTRELLLRINNQLESRKKVRERVMRELLIKTPVQGLNSTDDQFLQKAIALVEKNMENTEFDITRFTEEMGMSRSHLHKKLTAVTNQSATEFIRTIRLKKAAQLISEGLNVSEVYYRVGFNDRRYFTRVFSEQFGVPPSEYKSK